MTENGNAQGGQAKRLISRNHVVVGNLTADPELRYTQDSKAVCNFTLATTERVRNQQTNEWEDGETTFTRVSVWEHLAEHAAASLSKGVRTFASGTLRSREFVNKDNVPGYSLELTADVLGPDLRYGTAVYTRAAQQGQAQGAPQQQYVQPGAPVQGQPVQQYAQPVQGQPVQQYAQQPVQGQPVQGQPQPQYAQQPVQGQPVQQYAQPGAPVQGQPVQQYAQPVQGQPQAAGASVAEVVF